MLPIKENAIEKLFLDSCLFCPFFNQKTAKKIKIARIKTSRGARRPSHAPPSYLKFMVIFMIPNLYSLKKSMSSRTILGAKHFFRGVFVTRSYCIFGQNSAKKEMNNANLHCFDPLNQF